MNNYLNNNVSNKNHENTKEVLAALNLIAHLYKQNQIDQHIYKNILDDYKEEINIADFKIYS